MAAAFGMYFPADDTEFVAASTMQGGGYYFDLSIATATPIPAPTATPNPAPTASPSAGPTLFPTYAPTTVDGGRRQLLTAPLTTNGVPVCTAWPASTLLCDGAFCFQELAEKAGVDLSSLMAIHPKYFYDCLDLMVNYDAKWGLVTAGFQCDDPDVPTKSRSCSSVDRGVRKIHRPDGDMQYSTFQAIGFNLKDTDDHVDLIKSTNAACSDVKKAVGIDAYPMSTQTTWYTSFVTLEDDLLAGIGYALLAVVLAVAIMLLATQPPVESLASRAVGALWTALLLGASVLAIVFLTAGCMGMSGLYLNCLTAVTLISKPTALLAVAVKTPTLDAPHVVYLEAHTPGMLCHMPCSDFSTG